MALARDKRKLLFTLGALLTVIAICQLISYGKVLSVSFTNSEAPGRRFMIKQRLQRKSPEGRGCVTHTCVFFDVTFDAVPGGRIIFLLYDQKTPKTVENFRSLATGERGTSKKGTVLHYKGTSFHRIVQNMLIQGGDILRGKGKEGEVESIYGGAFAHERRNDTFDQRGLVAMASMGPDQNGSEFFITVDTLAELNGQYVVFGEVIEGMSIVDRINGLALNEDESPSIAVVIAECGQL
ncbi:unnamed protein product [Sphagnum jensenii]|uniref:Peptidyl-prolyl cis-trans isomerase n=1 Tax=Sphagnum jensenii TaxID=128206 RepID=A0ABP1AQH1_9BRYO